MYNRSINTNFNNLISEENQKIIIKRIGEDYNYSLKEAEEMFVETCRFLIMVAENRNSVFVPSKKIDEAWHVFLLYTKEYFAFCQSLGLDYIHHEPSDIENQAKRSTVKDTIQFMEENGIVFNRDLWVGGASCEGSGLYYSKTGSDNTCVIDCEPLVVKATI
jgi:hypothetical protein